MKVQSLTRAFDIVELLSREQHGLTLTEVSARLDLPQSTTYRLLSALKERRYVEQTKPSSWYRLGLAFVELSSLYLNRLELKTEAEPFLRELSQKTRQTVFMATRDGDQIVYIEKVEQFDSLRKYSIIGQRKPVYATSLGKALLLGLTDIEIREALAHTRFEALGPKTLTDLQRLLALLGMLFGRPDLAWAEEITTFDLPALIEAGMSTPPDWQSVRLGEVIPPFQRLGEILMQAMGMLKVGDGYSGLLTQLAQVIAEKAALLAAIADEIQALVDAITALIESAGLYVLHADGNGIENLIENVRTAEDAPPWSYESYVAGVCLLAGTADFGPVVELLGG